ncbi:hypothetical protein IEQ34_016501 [Dendrobium chrysotoxum]|uniref:Uncharacterized protein n=1 Tax=Dendrobium chrysotoxum TaxID=161865 RepID=A0AAV7GG93_DENCH|nr:hypothetical protein IEQ34_016501 [Dendrobium chrysotoxum]
MDRIHVKLVDLQEAINQHILKKKITTIKDENKRLQSLLSEKESKFKQELSPSRVIEEFKKSIAFNMIFKDHVKALELECTEEGFIRGFLKGVCLIQCKTGAEVEGLTPS